MNGGCATSPPGWECPKVTLDAWVRRGWADGYLHPQARLIIRADPAEVKRLQDLHETPRGQHMRRPWQQNQAASTNPDAEGSEDDGNRPRL